MYGFLFPISSLDFLAFVGVFVDRVLKVGGRAITEKGDREEAEVDTCI